MSNTRKSITEQSSKNNKNIFRPNHVAYYFCFLEQGLNHSETLLISFIIYYRLYCKPEPSYFQNEHLSYILKLSERTITNAFATLKDKNFVKLTYIPNKKGGTWRTVELITKNLNFLDIPDSYNPDFPKKK